MKRGPVEALSTRRTRVVCVRQVRLDVSGCTDMHCYGMRTILYPYDADKSTGKGGKQLWEAAEMFVLLLLQTAIELILACARPHTDLHRLTPRLTLHCDPRVRALAYLTPRLTPTYT